MFSRTCDFLSDEDPTLLLKARFSLAVVFSGLVALKLRSGTTTGEKRPFSFYVVYDIVATYYNGASCEDLSVIG